MPLLMQLDSHSFRARNTTTTIVCMVDGAAADDDDGDGMCESVYNTRTRKNPKHLCIVINT